jgi:hypothetical protein
MPSALTAPQSQPYVNDIGETEVTEVIDTEI